MKKTERGFTLIEILLAISVMGIVAIIISNTNIEIWKLFNYNTKLINLKQQGRLLTTLMEKDIREAIDVQIQDLDTDGDNELLLKFANSNDRDAYLLYKVHTPSGAEYGSIYRMKPAASDADSSKTDIGADGWPDTWPDSYSSPILSNIIEDYNYNDVYNDKTLIYFEFDLVNDNISYTAANQAYPRLIE